MEGESSTNLQLRVVTMTNTQDLGGTGRYLILLEQDAIAEGAREMTRVAGLRTVSTADMPDMSAAASFTDTDGLLLHELGVAVVNAVSDQITELSRVASAPGPIAVVEPERQVFAIAGQTADVAADLDEDRFTWGLQAVRAHLSAATGKDVGVAVLDTGLDLKHPDLAGRNVVTQSFIPGEDVQDGHGHGTHCIGTACGPRQPESGPGYGIADEAKIYAGKVLSNEGSGSDGGILSGIAWAVANGCRVVSMSLGAATTPGAPFSQTFERIARRAMQRGTLIVAAAGNESDRAAGVVAPVGHPANCPSVLAVGAVDPAGAVADFSCGTVDTVGQVDVIAPGVDVHSSWPMPNGYERLSGTSMATPHVAGTAALIAQHLGTASSWELWARLAQTATRLALPSTDVGAGLVQAP
jgi:subtilisin family serine protease